MRNHAIAISALTGALGAAAPAAAHDGAPMERTIVVTGQGEASAAPDIAYMTLGVQTEAPTAAEALRKNATQMDATIKALRDAGVDKKDIQTSSLNVGAQYDYSRENTAPRIIGYQASNTVSVKLRNLGGAGAIIDKAINVGANRLDSISFGFADEKPLRDAARKDAVKDARNRAALYADAAGVKLGPVLQISEGFSAIPGPQPVMMRMDAAEAASTPISAGESSVMASVTIIYRIE